VWPLPIYIKNYLKAKEKMMETQIISPWKKKPQFSKNPLKENQNPSKILL
jgi:hypothetical protein